ncbi:unnamed protein product, partial [Timema podura]|nr:unnamed protein product [Timema podura]
MYFIRIRHKNNIIPLIRSSLRYYSSVNENDYSETPEYPPIIDDSLDARKKRRKLSWHDKIKRLKTVEEKLFEINMPKYYGWRCFLLKEGVIPYNSLNFTQYATRTYLVKNEDLPAYYSKEIEEEASCLADSIQSQVEDAILFETCDVRRSYDLDTDDSNFVSPGEKETILTNSMVNQINNVILANLAGKYDHLLQAQVS